MRGFTYTFDAVCMYDPAYAIYQLLNDTKTKMLCLAMTTWICLSKLQKKKKEPKIQMKIRKKQQKYTKTID